VQASLAELKTSWESALADVRSDLAIEIPGRPSMTVPAILPESLGSPEFRRTHGASYALLSGAMANGIASVDLVRSMVRAGFVGIFGAAGLGLDAIEAAIDTLKTDLGDAPGWGVNLIHNPSEPNLEWGIADLLVRRRVKLVEASAYLNVSPAIVYYRASGLRREGTTGAIVADHRVIAKVSRVEVARRFLAPAPHAMLEGLVRDGHLTHEQAELARQIPLADDLTAEADSGGHTDNQPAIILFPTMIALRDQLARDLPAVGRVRIGAAGGISTPHAVAAALTMGVDYVVTGSINQACRESGSSDAVRRMLAEVRQAEVTMAPAADMFEMGVKLQVLKRGTLFPMRASKLYELYRTCDSLESLPAKDRAMLESTIFRQPIDQVWAETQEFFRKRDPEQLTRAVSDPKYRMALVFRWYLGQSSRWANRGVADRVMDYQVWCGPAMAAFNDWARGSFLDDPAQRSAPVVNLNLLYGASILLRARFAQLMGAELPPGVPEPRPLTRLELDSVLNGPFDENGTSDLTVAGSTMRTHSNP
jgi:PfaD family protein